MTEKNLVLKNDFINVVNQNMSTIAELSEKVKIANQNAEKAKKAAELASKANAKFGHHTKAIESLQDGLTAMSKAQQALTEANEESFKFQKQLASASVMLFNMGAKNLADNQAMQKIMINKINIASEEDFDERAMQEFQKIIAQLKAEETIMLQQEKQKIILSNQEISINNIKTDVNRLDENIDDVAEDVDAIEEDVEAIEAKNEEQDKLLKSHDENIDEIEEDVEAIEAKNEEQDILLKSHDENIDEIEEDVEAIEAKNEEQDILLKSHDENIDEIEEDVEAIEAKNEEQDILLKSHDENIDEIEEDVEAIEAKNEEQDILLKSHDENIDEIEEDVEENRADIRKNLDKINDLIAEVNALKNAETEAEKKIAQTRIIALVSGGIAVVSLVLSALNLLGII